jgi:DNA helicase-2/ATP-dependent DNA helicase PcrA
MEEERRLFYVAVTRAKDELYIMCPGETPGGWEGPSLTNPSRFLGELAAGDVDVIKDGRKVAYTKIFPHAAARRARDESGDGGFSDGDSWSPDFSGDSHLSSVLPPKAERAPSRPAPKGEEVTEPGVGERVRHVTFGDGVVVSFRNGRAVIDFDTCGRKNIVCRHAKLCRLKGG